MENQIGLPALKRRLLAEAPYIVAALPELPRLLHQRLLAPPSASDEAVKELAAAQRGRNRLLAAIAVLLVVAVGFLIGRPA
jgi:ubiquinone biosynthesis protein